MDIFRRVAKDLPLDIITVKIGFRKEPNIRYYYTTRSRLWNRCDDYVLSALLTDILGTIHIGIQPQERIYLKKNLDRLIIAIDEDRYSPNMITKFNRPDLISLGDHKVVELLDGEEYLIRPRIRNDFLIHKPVCSWPSDDVYQLEYYEIDDYFKNILPNPKDRDEVMIILNHILTSHQPEPSKNRKTYFFDVNPTSIGLLKAVTNTRPQAPFLNVYNKLTNISNLPNHRFTSCVIFGNGYLPDRVREDSYHTVLLGFDKCTLTMDQKVYTLEWLTDNKLPENLGLLLRYILEQGEEPEINYNNIVVSI